MRWTSRCGRSHIAIPVADEMLADSDAIRSFIDARLATGVLMTEEDQIVNGVGTPPNLSGILDREGLATAVVAAPTQTNADAILEQITAIESSQAFTVDGVIINPANWAAIIGSKDLEDRYYGAGPLGGSRDGDWIWGRRVVTSAAIEAGTAIVGAFQQACQILRNGGVTVEASNSHSDFFVHNMTAIRRGVATRPRGVPAARSRPGDGADASGRAERRLERNCARRSRLTRLRRERRALPDHTR